MPGLFSVPPQPPTGHAGTMDRAQEPQPRDSGAQVDTAATEGAQSHATGQGYRDTGKPRNRPQSRPQRRTGASNPQPREQYRRKRPQTPHRAAPGGGAIPILPAAKTPHSGAQSRPQRASRRGVRKRRGGQAHSRHSPGTAPRAKIRAVFCDFSSDFLPFFPAMSRSASEFHSRKSIVGKSKVGS